MTDPFLIQGPALISFSGGRTSAYMLWRILQAHDGRLPDDVVVAFANTGKEREETLRFVHECGSRWGVEIVWLEFLARSGPVEDRFERVGFNSASRNGEPFARLIASKKFTPNSAMRFCTEELKVNTIANFARAGLGWARWSNVVGLRFDEGARVLKAEARNAEGKVPWRTLTPLADARVVRSEVARFWAQQSFDLGLRSYEGNCDLCFLKGREALKTIMREQPGCSRWWIDHEAVGRGRFVTEYSYADLQREVTQQPHLFDPPPEQERDAECGDLCGNDSPAEIAAMQRVFEKTRAA